MATSTSMTRTLPFTIPSLKGKVAPISIVLAVKAATLAGVVFLYYVLAFFAAVQVVPTVMGFVRTGSGVTLDMPIETVLSVWVAPALFLVALVFVLLLVTMRSVWRGRSKVIARVSRWAFGESTAPVVDTKRTSTRTKTTTKTA